LKAVKNKNFPFLIGKIKNQQRKKKEEKNKKTRRRNLSGYF